jgi:SAM-dependent methyltransferase
MCPIAGREVWFNDFRNMRGTISTIRVEPGLLRDGRIAQATSYRGVLQIIRFNWPWYLGSASFVTASLLSVRFIANPAKSCLIGGALVALIWSLVSLLASHWVYDRSILRQWNWIADCVETPEHVANLHAGFDEISHHLRRLFPSCHFKAWDFYRSEIMTESSIARARKESATQATSVDLAHLPAAAESLDCAFLILSAHEIRTVQGRNTFFGELHRILKPGGSVLLVEHLRDWPNFLAYGPGCWHFLPRKEWLRLAAASGFSIADRFTITPFVNIFCLKKGEHELIDADQPSKSRCSRPNFHSRAQSFPDAAS